MGFGDALPLFNQLVVSHRQYGVFHSQLGFLLLDSLLFFLSLSLQSSCVFCSYVLSFQSLLCGSRDILYDLSSSQMCLTSCLA